MIILYVCVCVCVCVLGGGGAENFSPLEVNINKTSQIVRYQLQGLQILISLNVWSNHGVRKKTTKVNRNHFVNASKDNNDYSNHESSVDVGGGTNWKAQCLILPWTHSTVNWLSVHSHKGMNHHKKTWMTQHRYWGNAARLCNGTAMLWILTDLKFVYWLAHCLLTDT